MRGGSRSSRTLRWDAVDAERATDERARGGRRSCVVLAPRCWRQVRGKQNLPLMMVARKPGHQGERGVSCKPLRREGRIASAEPVCSCAFFCAFLHTRPRVQRAPGLPCALCSSSAGETDAAPGRIAPRQCGIASVCCFLVIARSQRVRPFGRPDDRLRDEAIHSFFPLRDGLLR